MTCLVDCCDEVMVCSEMASSLSDDVRLDDVRDEAPLRLLPHQRSRSGVENGSEADMAHSKDELVGNKI